MRQTALVWRARLYGAGRAYTSRERRWKGETPTQRIQKFVGVRFGNDFCFVDLHFSFSALSMENPVPKFDEWESEDALLADIDAKLLAKWDGVSLPTPDLFIHGQLKCRDTLVEYALDVRDGRTLMVAIQGKHPDFKSIKQFVGESCSLAFERRTNPSYMQDLGTAWLITKKCRVWFITKKGLSPHRLSLFMRLTAESHQFESYLKAANTAPPQWFNRYLCQARLEMLRGLSVADALFTVHVSVMDCDAKHSRCCEHIPQEMINEWNDSDDEY